MQIGDIIVVSGQSFVSHKIQDVVESPWTHVALYVGADRILEIDWNTRATLIENPYTKGSFDHVVLRPKKRLKAWQQRKIIKSALFHNDKGTRYDWFLLFSLYMEKKFPKLKWLFDSKNHFICTELVDTILSEVGVDLFPDHEGNIYPHDFVLSPALEIVSSGTAAAA